MPKPLSDACWPDCGLMSEIDCRAATVRERSAAKATCYFQTATAIAPSSDATATRGRHAPAAGSNRTLPQIYARDIFPPPLSSWQHRPRLGGTLDFDPAHEHFPNHPEADRLLSRNYRNPYM